MTYEKSFKEEAVRLSDEIGVKKAAEQLGVPYYTLVDWRQQRKRYSSQAYAAGTSACRQTQRSSVFTSWKKRTASFSGQTRFCRRRSVFSQKTGRSKSAAAVCICGGAHRQMARHGAVPCAGAQ